MHSYNYYLCIIIRKILSTNEASHVIQYSENHPLTLHVATLGLQIKASTLPVLYCVLIVVDKWRGKLRLVRKFEMDDMV
jgi:hypothetical protein